MKINKNMIITSLTVLVLAAVLAASGRGQTAHTVGIKSKEGVGRHLVDSKGMTLYNLKNDSQGKSTCTGECAGMWPPYYAESITVPPGLKASHFGTITRDDGKKQTTYKGMPLYYFADDKKPGDTNGNGVHNIWFPATPAGSSW
jgi:predicted lipoprotein with Yx(FWY)xxD motif